MRRIVLGLIAVFVFTLGLPRPSEALQSLTWEFVIDCADPSGMSTSELGFDMPSGVYAATVEGACLIDFEPGRRGAVVIGTPCSAPIVGPIPCIPEIETVENVPRPLCWIQAAEVWVQGCDGLNVVLNGCTYVVLVDGNCLPLGKGSFYHNPGPMRAWFDDGHYPDNVGLFTITVVWTPL